MLLYQNYFLIDKTSLLIYKLLCYLSKTNQIAEGSHLRKMFQKIFTRKDGFAHAKIPSFRIRRKIFITQLPLMSFRSRQKSRLMNFQKKYSFYSGDVNFLCFYLEKKILKIILPTTFLMVTVLYIIPAGDWTLHWYTPTSETFTSFIINKPTSV